MKRLTSLFLALLLALSAVSCAAAEGVAFKTKYFTLILPDGWEIDMEPLDDMEDEEGFEYLGLFCKSKGVGLAGMAYLVYYDNLADVSLWNADQAELEDYAEAVMEDFADEHPVYLGTLMAGTIPFVLIKAEDEDGEYLYADTMTNGYAIEIEAFVVDEDWETQYPLTDKYIEQFRSILATFQPVT